MKKLSLSLVVLLFIFAAIVPYSSPALAQGGDEEALQRVDQALQHLSGFLGQTINRQSHFWTWEEKIFNDASLDCPVPGNVYAQVLTRAYEITVTVDEQIFTYRITDDGNLLVLCGANGSAIFRSDTPIIAPPPGSDGATFTLQAAAWHAWIYTEVNDRLYLVNPTGEQVILNRPRASGEAIGQTPPRMAISPNGKFLLQAVAGPNSAPMLTIYDFELGNFVATIPAAAGETIFLGFGSSQFAGSPYIFDPLSRRAAVGIRNETTGAWRLAIIDLATGTQTRVLQHTDLAGILANPPADLQAAVQEATRFFPRPVYFDGLGGVHVQLVLANAGGASRYSAFVWYPDSNIASPSPYIHSSIDILPPNGTALFTLADASVPALPPTGPFESHNAVAQGTPGGATFTPQILYRNSSFFFFGAKWADNGQRIIFQLDDGVNLPRWALFNPTSGAQPDLLPATFTAAEGVPGGLIAFDPNNALTFISGLDAYQQVWTSPPRVGNPNIIWVQPPNTGLGLTTVSLVNFGQSDTPVTGVQFCAGAPLSRLSVGMMARVSFTDGTPLRLRQTAGTGGTFIKDMPEGTQFAVIGGPECQNSLTWWNVQLGDGSSGWAAEGDSDEYFIEPVSG